MIRLLAALWDSVPVPLQLRVGALAPALHARLDAAAGRADEAHPGRRGVTSW